ncbi:MAG: thioredoxin-dependent thiol peroxidase [Sphingobacteriales bacterium]|jgi:peroxiredoxin Q/BCP|nr:thioredoxin-dependent thiol peroxidase [Sphingobacteriales bacterium]
MATHLTEGQKAPAFTGKDQNGKKIYLKDFVGQKLVLYFYPKDDTPGCTAQACNLRDNENLLKENGFAILGVSPDEVSSHKKFEAKYSLPFPLIADPAHSILEKYGVWGEKNLYGKIITGVLRTTFVIDEQGIIIKIFKRPDTKAHAEQILKALKK